MTPLSPQSVSAAAKLVAVEAAVGHIPPHLTSLRRALDQLREQAILAENTAWQPALAQMEKALEGIRLAIDPLLTEWTSRPPFDPRQLEILREEGLLESLTTLFEGMVDRTFGEMKISLTCGNSKALADAAHLLKGSAVNFGATAFAATCQALEQQAFTAQPVALQALLDQLEADHRDLMDALHREIAQR